jgi:hypothetical protein
MSAVRYVLSENRSDCKKSFEFVINLSGQQVAGSVGAIVDAVEIFLAL